MNGVPTNPKIYHITHLRNLEGIVAAGRIWSDAKRLALGLTCEVVGMGEVKRRRLEERSVKCHSETKVGEYVPFYFCPRSIMLYILHKGNHPSLSYHEGQRPIVHVVADLSATIRSAEQNRVRWAFSDRNAAATLAQFYRTPADLEKISWDAVANPDFRDAVVMEGKQAEFLMFESFPWSLVEQIGVLDDATAEQVRGILQRASHKPPVTVQPGWYY